jgi:hypothetical protein
MPRNLKEIVFLSFLYFISPNGGPTFNVRYVYTTEASNNSRNRRFLSNNYEIVVRVWHPEIYNVGRQLIILRYRSGTGTDPVLIQTQL